MKKQTLSLFLSLCIVVCLLLSGCGVRSKDTHMKNVLIIGNSHSVDAFYLLHQAFTDQYPDKDFTLGVLYYSGCSIDKHVSFAENEDAVYHYYKNTDGSWVVTKKQTMKEVLQDQEWDTILLQAAKSDLDETLNLDGRRALESYANQYVKIPHRFVWHTSWPSPNDDCFFSEDWETQPPEGYREKLIRLYGFDPVKQYQVLIDKANTCILPDKTYTTAVCTGTAIMYAHLTASLPQTELWRDYTHLTDYGRLIAAYSLLSQLSGEPIEVISIETIPSQLRHSRYKSLGDLVLTESMKATIVQAANYSLTAPFSIPPTTAEQNTPRRTPEEGCPYE